MTQESKEFLNKFIHEKGRSFYPALLPEDVAQGKVGDCFDHCLLEAVKSNGKYFYCEGKAYIEGKWFHHAWLTDKTGFVAFDPTWRMEDSNGNIIHMVVGMYVGAILNTGAVVDFVRTTEYKSPFANYEKNPELAQKVYDSAH